MNGSKDEAGRQGAPVDGRLAEAVHLQAMEGNPLSPDEVAMFETFERERMPPGERRVRIARRLEDRARIAAAE